MLLFEVKLQMVIINCKKHRVGLIAMVSKYFENSEGIFSGKLLFAELVT